MMYGHVRRLAFTVYEYRGSALSLYKIRRNDMGAFMCIANNGVPPTISKRIVLNVNCELGLVAKKYLNLSEDLCYSCSDGER